MPGRSGHRRRSAPTTSGHLDQRRALGHDELEHGVLVRGAALGRLADHDAGRDGLVELLGHLGLELGLGDRDLGLVDGHPDDVRDGDRLRAVADDELHDLVALELARRRGGSLEMTLPLSTLLLYLRFGVADGEVAVLDHRPGDLLGAPDDVGDGVPLRALRQDQADGAVLVDVLAAGRVGLQHQALGHDLAEAVAGDRRSSGRSSRPCPRPAARVRLSRPGVVVLLSGPSATNQAMPESTTASATTSSSAIGPRLRRPRTRVPCAV